MILLSRRYRIARHPRRASHPLKAGPDREGIDQADDDKKPQHLVFRHAINSPGAPGPAPDEPPRGHAAGIDEFRAPQAGDSAASSPVLVMNTTPGARTPARAGSARVPGRLA